MSLCEEVYHSVRTRINYPNGPMLILKSGEYSRSIAVSAITTNYMQFMDDDWFNPLALLILEEAYPTQYPAIADRWASLPKTTVKYHLRSPTQLTTGSTTLLKGPPGVIDQKQLLLFLSGTSLPAD
jgi:hypothetical protein